MSASFRKRLCPGDQVTQQCFPHFHSFSLQRNKISELLKVARSSAEQVQDARPSPSHPPRAIGGQRYLNFNLTPFSSLSCLLQRLLSPAFVWWNTFHSSKSDMMVMESCVSPSLHFLQPPTSQRLMCETLHRLLVYETVCTEPDIITLGLQTNASAFLAKEALFARLFSCFLICSLF